MIKHETDINTDNEDSIYLRIRNVLGECYNEAEKLVQTESTEELRVLLSEHFKSVSDLGEAKHAARGVVLTLATYKVVQPTQDVRRHKSEFDGGFSARSIDTKVTVPFLEQQSLPYNVESHWLTQTFSFAGPLEADITLKTVPKIAGPYTVKITNAIENAISIDFAKAVVILLLVRMIEERNKGRVLLTKPKNLSIDEVIRLLEQHFNHGYHKNTPRLPQIAIYSLYCCLMDGVDRYSNYKLRALERMKTANRKSGSVGDIDVELNGQPIEAVEIKYEVEITEQHLAEAIQKIKTASVERYFILSTAGILEEDFEDISRLKEDFRKSNGCEIIVNGVYGTIRYYLRLLRSTNDFINRYTDLLEVDADLDYEHKLAWNSICAKR